MTDTSKATPRPWTVKDAGYRIEVRVTGPFPSDAAGALNGHPIAIIPIPRTGASRGGHPRSLRQPLHEANAHLIVQAVNAYDALRLVTTTARAVSTLVHQGGSQFWVAVEAMQNALAAMDALAVAEAR